MLKVTRTSADAFSASAFSRARFTPCIGARDDAASASLAAAIRRQWFGNIRSLVRNTQPDDTAWCAGDGWWLSTRNLDVGGK
jgi:protein-L-isoaspartate(D-aspartate) O-methyltransferase